MGSGDTGDPVVSEAPEDPLGPAWAPVPALPLNLYVLVAILAQVQHQLPEARLFPGLVRALCEVTEPCYDTGDLG